MPNRTVGNHLTRSTACDISASNLRCGGLSLAYVKLKDASEEERSPGSRGLNKTGFFQQHPTPGGESRQVFTSFNFCAASNRKAPTEPKLARLLQKDGAGESVV